MFCLKTLTYKKKKKSHHSSTAKCWNSGVMNAPIHCNPLLMHNPMGISGAISPQTSPSLKAVTAAMVSQCPLLKTAHPCICMVLQLSCCPSPLETSPLVPSGHVQSLAPRVSLQISSASFPATVSRSAQQPRNIVSPGGD